LGLASLSGVDIDKPIPVIQKKVRSTFSNVPDEYCSLSLL